MKAGSALFTLVALGMVGVREARAASDRAAFEPDSLEDALKALGGRPVGSAQVVLSALDITEDGSSAPVGVVSHLPGTTEIHLLVEKNPVPLSASFKLPPGTAPDVRLRIKMAQSSQVLAVIRAEGQLYFASKLTNVTIGSCGAVAPDEVASGAVVAPDPIRIRASLSGQDTTVRLLMPHPMESGNRKTASGASVPAHHISDVVVTHNGRLVLQAQFGPSVSRDPLLAFRFMGANVGDTVAVSWTDTQQLTRSAQARVI